MHQIKLLVLFIFFVASCTPHEIIEPDSVGLSTRSTNHPNIVLIIADDMGLDACPGYNIAEQKPNMPNLQKLISTGIVFNNVWSNSLCSPTRASILTGKYGIRTGVTKVDVPLSTSEVSLQQEITEKTNSEYSSAVIGKWHLSTEPTHPSKMGVNYFAGILRGAVPSYYNWDLYINGSASTSVEYATSKLTDLAIDWVAEQSKPWFLWLAYNAPHTPFHLPPVDLYSNGFLSDNQYSIDADPLSYYLAMLEAMDTEMGRFINSMTTEQRDNTVFIFIGDNGTPRRVVQSYGASHAKGTIYQGGVNVPMVVSGVNVSRKNETEDALINTTDLFATIADIAGAEIKEIYDSKSFKSLLTDPNGKKRDYVYAEQENDYTIRNATHKYLVFDDGTEELYDLVNDPFEQRNLMQGDQLPLSNDEITIYEELKLKVEAMIK